MGEPLNPGNLPKHVVILTKHSGCLRTTLADQIESVARNLHERFVVKDYQLEDILEKAKSKPEDGVSHLIDIIKRSQEHFDEFIQCLNDMGYTGLVEKLTGTVVAAEETTEKVNTTCKITNLPDAVAIEGRKGLIFTISGETSGNQPLVFKSSWDPKEAEQYFTLHPEHDELHVHVESDSVFTCNSVTLTVKVNDGISESLPANLEIIEWELRAILIGKTGVGKSGVGNSILNLPPDARFISKASAASVTRHNLCKHGVIDVDDVKYLFKILDTPGLSDTQVSHQEVSMELAKSINDLAPGPHIFCFVLSVDRIDEHIMNIIQQYKDLFGECLKTYGVIIFTKKDSLEETTFTKYLEDVKPEFKEFLEDYCDNRYSLINNKNPQPDVQGILSLMLKTKRNNNGEHYRNAMFEEAKKLYAEKLKKMEDEKTKVERELKQQLELKEENEKKFLEREREFDENEKKLKQQLKLKEENEKRFMEREMEFDEKEKKFKEQEKRFDEMNYKFQQTEWENKQLKEQVHKLQDKSPKSLEETDVNSVTNPQPQIAEVEQLKQTVDIRNVDFVKLCNLLLQDGYLNEKDKENIVSSESSNNTIDTLMDILNKNNNKKAYIIVINHLKSGTIKETHTTTQDDPTHETMVQADQSDGIKTDNENKEKTDIEVVAKPNITDSSQTFLLEKDENQTLLEEHIKKNPSDQETDVNYVTNPQPQIAEVENSKQTLDIRSEDFETLSNPSGQEIDLKTATVSQPQIAEVEKLRHTVNIQNIDFVKLCNLLLQDGYLNEKDKEAIVSSESPINTMDTLMDMLTKTNNSKAYKIVINHLKSGTSMETTSSTQVEYQEGPSHAKRRKVIPRREKDVRIIDSDDSSIDVQATDGKPLDVIEQEPLDVDDTGDSDHSLPTDDKSVDAITKGTDDKYDHLVIDEENKGMTISDDKTTDNNIMDLDSIRRTCLRGTLDDVKNLILHNKDFNIRGESGETPLFDCVVSVNQPVEKVKLLVSTGVRLDVKDRGGRSLLHWACWRSTTIDCIKYLLEQGLDKDGRADNNQTPLFYCVWSDYQQLEKMKLLVSSGAMVDVKDNGGRSLLYWARWFHRTECELYLRELGLDK